MPLNEEQIGKLSVTLAGDIDLFNEVINEDQKALTTISEKEQELQQTTQKLEEVEKRSQEYLTQISNLLSKIPVGNSNTPQSVETQLEEIKNRAWVK